MALPTCIFAGACDFDGDGKVGDARLLARIQNVRDTLKFGGAIAAHEDA
jgi:hypothetical protein